MLHLHADGTLAHEPPAQPAVVEFDQHRERASFAWRADRDVELIGPMRLRVGVEAVGTDDVSLFAGVRKLRGGRVVGFEGSYGFDRALVTFGMRRSSLRDVPELHHRPLAAGEVVQLEVELAPHATHVAAGEVLRLEVQCRWFFPTNPLAGQFPARYEASSAGRCRLHLGGDRPSALVVLVNEV